MRRGECWQCGRLYKHHNVTARHNRGSKCLTNYRLFFKDAAKNSILTLLLRLSVCLPVIASSSIFFFLIIIFCHAWQMLTPPHPPKTSLTPYGLNSQLNLCPFLSPPTPSKGIQASQPAVTQSAAAFGHHWVPRHTHIRQAVCWDGLWHLGSRLSTPCWSHNHVRSILSQSFLPCTPAPSCFKQGSSGLRYPLQISGGSEVSLFLPRLLHLTFPCMFMLSINLFNWPKQIKILFSFVAILLLLDLDISFGN